MKFKTKITYIDVDSGEILNCTPTEFWRDYNFSKRKDKTIINKDICTINYIYEGTKKNQLEINFNNNQKSL